MDIKIILNKVLGASIFEAPKAKNNKGVSLIALIITIIVIIIIAGIALSSFNSITQEKATSTKILNEFIEVENAVSQRGAEHKLDALVYPYVGTQLVSGEFINNKYYDGRFYLLKEDDLIELGITGTQKEYIVNYETGEVIVKEPYLLGSRLIYDKTGLIEEELRNSVTGEGEYDEKKGVNKPILYTGMIPVKRSGDNYWVVTSPDDDEWYDYAVTGKGPVRYANVMLLDDMALEGITNEKLRTLNLESMVGKKVVKEGSMFIWIPRYTYNGNSIVYSKRTIDYTKNGYVKSPAFYNGEYVGATTNDSNAGYIAGGKELTGIWISKYEASYSE